MRKVERRGHRLSRWATLCAAMWVLASIAWCRVQGEPPKSEAAPGAAAKAKAEPKARKKPRGRLPRYYGNVVTRKQREEIYAIQKRYQAQIDELRKQLSELVRKRDEEVAGVLTAEQRAEVEKLREAAAKRRRARRSARTAKR